MASEVDRRALAPGETSPGNLSRGGPTSAPRFAPEAIERTCPNCDASMDVRSCKLRCPRCGYFKSCSDF